MATSLNEGHALPAGKASNLRRSQRVCLNVDVEVEIRRGKEKLPVEKTKTLIVSAHGALILLQTPVSLRDLLQLRHGKTDEATECRVVDVNMGNNGVPEVGIEFLQPHRNFWRIAFPPLDWSPRGPESKVLGPQAVAGVNKSTKP